MCARCLFNDLKKNRFPQKRSFQFTTLLKKGSKNRFFNSQLLNCCHSREHYAVVVDAGSSGSRAYLYSWPAHSGRRHELLKIEPLTGGGGDGRPKYKKVKPGLSR